MIVFGMSSNIKVQEDVPDALRAGSWPSTPSFSGNDADRGMELGFMARHLNASLAIGINAGLC